MTKGHQSRAAIEPHPDDGLRRWIERPRLLRRLDAAESRMILVLAPAGYGKTTLARQWTEPRPAAWYRATPAAADVAVVAAGIAEAASAFVPGLAETLAARVIASRNPESEAGALGEVAAQHIETWPDDAWIVVDDAHLVSSPAAAAFMEALIDNAPVRLFILSRRRPVWLPVRRTVYGEVFELHQEDMTFTLEESQSVLARANAQVVADLHERSQGWPAVIGLAGANPSLRLPEDGLPSELYEFFADELLMSVEPAMARRLTELSIVPHLRPEVIEAIVPDAAELLDEAVRSGFVTRDPTSGFSFHPLLRAFFHSKVTAEQDPRSRAARVAHVLLEQRLWEDAFDVVRLFGLHDRLPELFEGLNDMLSQGRLATVEGWISYSSNVGRHFPLIDLAEAEVARRQGHFGPAEVQALRAARHLEGTAFESRAYVIAAESVYYDASRLELSYEYGARAQSVATTDADEYRAVWAQVLSASEIKDADLAGLVDRLSSKLTGDPNIEIRAAGARLLAAARIGRVGAAAREAEHMMGLLAHVTDPLAKTFFLHQAAYLNVLASQYERGEELARVALDEIDRSRLDFARAPVISTAAAAQLGTRRFRRAELALKIAGDAAHKTSFAYEEVNVRALVARLELARRRPQAAFQALDVREVDGAHPTLRGECRALLAVAAAIGGESRTATRLAQLASEDTAEVQSQCFVALARAIIRRSRASIAYATQTLERTQATDCLVCTYRAYPRLLRDVADEPGALDVPRIVRQARDHKIALDLGISLADGGETRGRFDLLTRREREVFGLMCEGLTNREIADRLYLSQSTVKLHVRHILSKLEVRSRTEAVLLAGGDGEGP